MRIFSILSHPFDLRPWVVTPDFALAQDEPWLGLVPEVVHTEGELAGMTTYRLYLYTLNETDFLVSCSGDDENNLVLAEHFGTGMVSARGFHDGVCHGRQPHLSSRHSRNWPTTAG